MMRVEQPGELLVSDVDSLVVRGLSLPLDGNDELQKECEERAPSPQIPLILPVQGETEKPQPRKSLLFECIFA